GTTGMRRFTISPKLVPATCRRRKRAGAGRNLPPAKEKGGPEATLRNLRKPTCSGRLVLIGEDRAGILALGLDIAIDELDHRERCIVAEAEARLHVAQIAAI